MTLKELITRYLDSLRDTRKAYSMTHYRKRLDIFEKYLEEKNVLFPSDLTMSICKGYGDWLQGRKLSSNTRYLYLDSVIKYVKWLYVENFLFLNAAEGLSLPGWEKKIPVKLSEKAVRERIETPSNSMTLPEIAKRNQAILALVFNEHLTVQEIKVLSVLDIDLMSGRLRRVRRRKFESMSVLSQTYLKAYLKERPRLNPRTEHLFTGQNGQPMTDYSIRRMITDAKRPIPLS